MPLSAREGKRRLVEREAKSLCRFACLFVCAGRFHSMELEAKGDLVLHGLLADLTVGVLEERRARTGDDACGSGFGISARNAYVTRIGFEQTREKLGERGLACAVLAYQPYEFAWTHFKGEVVYRSPALGIGKINMFECDHGFLRCCGAGRMGRGGSDAARIV